MTLFLVSGLFDKSRWLGMTGRKENGKGEANAMHSKNRLMPNGSLSETTETLWEEIDHTEHWKDGRSPCGHVPSGNGYTRVESCGWMEGWVDRGLGGVLSSVAGYLLSV